MSTDRAKPRIELPIVVEGKYDKNTLMQIFDATVIPVGGFSIFNSREKQALLRRVSERGIILLTDSDGGGRQIRAFLNGIVPKERIHNVYIPAIAGKEKRKKHPSRQGLLGVEGVGREVLLRALFPFVVSEGDASGGGRAEFETLKEREPITKTDMYLDGLSGSANAAARRAELARSLGLPTDMSAPALLEALNLICGREEYKRIIAEKLDTGAADAQNCGDATAPRIENGAAREGK